MADARKPTIYDVAHTAGVSIATVSRVLNSPNQVREETRSKVLSVIDQLDFVPKAEAIARARKEVGRIGVLTPFFTFPSFVQRVRGMAKALSITPYELIIYTVDSLTRLKEYLAMLPVSRRLDGLVIMSLPIDEDSANRLIKNDLKTVLIEYSHPSFSSVTINDRHGGALAAKYLLKKGHRRCAYIGDTGLPDYSIRPEEKRLEGYRRTLNENNIPLPDEYLKLPELTMQSLEQQVKELLALPKPPTAVFAATDELAMRVLRVAREQAVQVPDDLAVIGFDDLDVAEYLDLTTVRQPLDESGQTAVELLLGHIAAPSRSLKNIELKLSIVERETA